MLGQYNSRVTREIGVWRRIGSLARLLPLVFLGVMLGGVIATIRTGDDGIICLIPGVESGLSAR
jgi:hypothetical protein